MATAGIEHCAAQSLQKRITFFSCYFISWLKLQTNDFCYTTLEKELSGYEQSVDLVLQIF